MDVCSSTEDIEVATGILNITPDVAMTTDDELSFGRPGRPIAQSTPVDIDEADLLDEDENVDQVVEEQVDEDEVDDNIIVIFSGSFNI